MTQQRVLTTTPSEFLDPPIRLQFTDCQLGTVVRGSKPMGFIGLLKQHYTRALLYYFCDAAEVLTFSHHVSYCLVIVASIRLRFNLKKRVQICL